MSKTYRAKMLANKLNFEPYDVQETIRVIEEAVVGGHKIFKKLDKNGLRAVRRLQKSRYALPTIELPKDFDLKVIAGVPLDLPEQFARASEIYCSPKYDTELFDCDVNILSEEDIDLTIALKGANSIHALIQLGNPNITERQSKAIIISFALSGLIEEVFNTLITDLLPPSKKKKLVELLMPVFLSDTLTANLNLGGVPGEVVQAMVMAIESGHAVPEDVVQNVMEISELSQEDYDKAVHKLIGLGYEV